MKDRRSAALIHLLWVLVALPTLAHAEDANAKACQESRYIASRAERLGNCNGGFGELQRLAGIYEKKLDLPPEVALALARAMRDSHEAVDKRVRERRMPTIEAMRGMESQFILLLDMEPERAALVDEVADFYASWNLGLGSPAPALLERVARARDPIAFASRLAQRSTWSGDDPFYTEVFLAAATARPDAPGLWQQAARFARRPGVKAALFEQAYRVYLGPRAAAPGSAEVPIALALAGQWLKAELDNGLAAEAVATFHALPPALRRALAAGTIPWILERTIPGMDFSHTDEDLRLPLAAACLLVGDRTTAGELLAGTAQWPGNEDRSADILDQSLAHDPRGQEDPFELFVRTLGRQPNDIPPAVVALAFARFAERERYPTVAAYCLRKVTERLADLRELRETGQPVPAGLLNLANGIVIASTARRLEGEVESLYQTTEEEIRTQTAAGSADLRSPPQLFRSRKAVATAGALAAVLTTLEAEKRTTDRCLVADRAAFADLAPDPRWSVLSVEELKTAWQAESCGLALPLFFLDRSGRRGFAVWNDSYFRGGTIVLAETGRGWVARRDGIWIS